MSRAATKYGECAARQSVVSRAAAPDSRQHQPAEWRSFPPRRLDGTNVADLVRPRAQAACSQLRWFAHRFNEQDERARHASHSPLPPSKPIAPTRWTEKRWINFTAFSRSGTGIFTRSGRSWPDLTALASRQSLDIEEPEVSGISGSSDRSESVRRDRTRIRGRTRSVSRTRTAHKALPPNGASYQYLLQILQRIFLTHRRFCNAPTTSARIASEIHRARNLLP